jgi:hypothetical protein
MLRCGQQDDVNDRDLSDRLETLSVSSSLGFVEDTLDAYLYRIFTSHLVRDSYQLMYRDPLRAGRSVDRIPVGGEILRTCPDQPWGPPIQWVPGHSWG